MARIRPIQCQKLVVSEDCTKIHIAGLIARLCIMLSMLSTLNPIQEINKMFILL